MNAAGSPTRSIPIEARLKTKAGKRTPWLDTTAKIATSATITLTLGSKRLRALSRKVKMSEKSSNFNSF